MKKHQFATLCVHKGTIKDVKYNGSVSPIYVSSSYAFEDVEEKRYPRYFNTPNQEGLSAKIAALENADKGIIFSSGMAAISTSLLAFLKKGDHVVFQNSLYGGTTHLITKEFKNFGIDYSFTEGVTIDDFKKVIQSKTKVIYIETPSNPMLKIIDIEKIAFLAKERNIMTMIDNTFASPVNQNPINYGIDIVIHSATKYLGGHSDISAGAVVGTKENIAIIAGMAKRLGGNLSDFTVWLLERSIKTLFIRVKKQNENAMILANYLKKHSKIKKVFYPGLETHPNHIIAKKQMKGFGGMLSFELEKNIDSSLFLKKLSLISPSMSLAGVESSMLLPCLTSHALISEKEREKEGITNQLIRFSLGIENSEDLIKDIDKALIKI